MIETAREDKTDAGKEQSVRVFLLDAEQIARRLMIQSWVRFWVVVAIVAGALGGKYVVGVEQLDVSSLILLAGLLALFNVNVYFVLRRFREEEVVREHSSFLHGLMHLTIDVDFFFLTVGLWFVGGPNSPFIGFYLVHVILAGILLTPRAAYLHTLFGYALFAGLVLGEWFEWIPAPMPLGAVNSAAPLDGRFVLTVLVVQGGLMSLSVFMSVGLARLLREGEMRLREANAALEQAATIRKDFFHIVLHDLKSPISSAQMVLHSMLEDPESCLPEKKDYWVGRLRARLQEAMTLLRDFDVMAALEGNVIEKNRKPVDLAALIRLIVQEREELINEHEHHVTVELEPDLPRVSGVERLLHEAIANYVTNAAKYTPPGGQITVRAFRKNGHVRVEVEDNGIGISEEDQKRLFREFVRVRRSASSERQSTGSGLGLSIVRRIIEAHGGSVGVRSQLNQGSVFYLELPAETPSDESVPMGLSASR
ncbi:MAG TPA: HAMP domain-containing sensor histidine kinase [Candidatus Hydrogenedentes bacterium]|nr:HAMP domain-containing sensor histidine kinase [Candidatus Hydrogenedentota bacterium]HPO86204.1 HAMP domain-containing sensor histidine kinase [Candidatus Hydrogenedentota bacterium]